MSPPRRPRPSLLINQPFLVQRSWPLPAEFGGSAESDEARIARAYRLAFGRPPSAGELTARTIPRRAGYPGFPERPKLATFYSDKMPYREGRAAVVEARSAQERFVVPRRRSCRSGAFTVEGYVLLRTAPAPGMRSIAARWDGDTSHAGWALGGLEREWSRHRRRCCCRAGVPGRKWFQPGTEFSSGVALDLNKPYHVSAAAAPGEAGEVSVTFVVKDLSNDRGLPESSRCGRRPVRSLLVSGPGEPFTVGGLAGLRGPAGTACWMMSARRRGRFHGPLLLLSGDTVPAGAGWWRFEATPGAYLIWTSTGSHSSLRPRRRRTRWMSDAGAGGLLPRASEFQRVFVHRLLDDEVRRFQDFVLGRPREIHPRAFVRIGRPVQGFVRPVWELFGSAHEPNSIHQL